MSNINTKILDDSMFVEDCYEAQTRAFSPGEYHFITDLAMKHRIKKFPDEGPGNGDYFAGKRPFMISLKPMPIFITR